MMISIPINQEFDIVKARTTAKQQADELGFGLVDQTRISTAVSELARNIFLYAGSGEVLIQDVANPHPGIRITFIDQGPGIKDIELALKDGFSTSKSMGKGLPGAKRLCDLLEIHSEPDKGTTVIVEKWLPI